MRIAALVLGLILTVGLFVQSLLVTTGEALAGEEESSGAVGVFVALLFLVAAALVIAKPRFSMWLFAGAAVLALLVGASSAFSDLIFWGIVGGVLALLSWRGSLEKRRQDAEERAGREALLTLAAQKQSAPDEPSAGAAS